MSPFVNPHIQIERPFVSVYYVRLAFSGEKSNPVRLLKQLCFHAHFLLSAPLLWLVLGIRQLIPLLDTLHRSP